jgi:hypothetical protein
MKRLEGAQLYTLRKNSYGLVVVELAFRPASNPFVFEIEAALADGTGVALRVFPQPV